MFKASYTHHYRAGLIELIDALEGCSQGKHKTRHELKRLARNAAELMGLSAALEAGGIQLELLTGPLTGVHDPNGMGAMLFAVLAVAAQLDREYIREKILEGQQAAAAKGNHGGRPEVIDDDMLLFARALQDKGTPIPEIAKKLSIKTGYARQIPLRRIPVPRPGRSRLAARRDTPLTRLPQFKINSWRVSCLPWLYPSWAGAPENHQQPNKTVLTPHGGHDIPAAINSPGNRQGHGLCIGLKAQEQQVLTCRRPPSTESAGWPTR